MRERQPSPRTAVGGVVGLAVLLGGCTAPYAPQSDDHGSYGTGGGEAVAASCSSLLERVISRLRAGDTDGAINGELDALGAECPTEYDVFVDYVTLTSFAEVAGNDSCAEIAAHDVMPAALDFAVQEGLCSAGPVDDLTVAPTWSCGYSPTYNDDWHDDVVCTNGADEQRPYLREWDDFISEDEIMESAREYEAQLNAG